jgi:hypothetical protein
MLLKEYRKKIGACDILDVEMVLVPWSRFDIEREGFSKD